MAAIAVTPKVLTFQEMLKTRSITLPELVDQAVIVLENRANREAQSADLAGEDSGEVYDEVLGDIDRTIDKLKRRRKYVQFLRNHVHKWDNETDYCLICGADGRA